MILLVSLCIYRVFVTVPNCIYDPRSLYISFYNIIFVYFCLLFYVLLCHFFYFFFSSIRRHTRCLSDWSSDVCSSDLPPRADPLADRRGGRAAPPRPAGPRRGRWIEHARARLLPLAAPRRLRRRRARRLRRSEERRVGKEYRSREWV